MNDITTGRGPRRSRNDDVRASDSLARAEARMREIRGTIGTDDGSYRDKFWAPEAPDGWSYEWKRRTVYGKEDPSYQVELIRQGWEPVPLERHPEMMPAGWSGNVIEVEGMTLMERPLVLTEEARAREHREARGAVRAKEEQLGVAPSGHFERSKREVKKGFAPIPQDD